MFHAVFFCLLIAFPLAADAVETVISANYIQARPTNSNHFPISYDGSLPNAFQYFYPAYFFGSTPRYITGMAYRTSPVNGGFMGLGTYQDDVIISMAISTVPLNSGVSSPLNMTDLTQNYDLATKQVVTQGLINITAIGEGYKFDTNIPIQTPFLYDPTLGNLMVEWYLPASFNTGQAGNFQYWDNDDSAVVIRVTPGFISEGLVTQFTSAEKLDCAQDYVVHDLGYQQLFGVRSSDGALMACPEMGLTNICELLGQMDFIVDLLATYPSGKKRAVDELKAEIEQLSIELNQLMATNTL